MNIKIEQTKDFRALARLNESVQTWHHNNYPQEFKPYDQIEVEKALQEFTQAESFFGFIAKLENKPIGYLIGYVKSRAASAFQFKKEVLYIDQIAVIPAHQKSGVGQLLMDETYQLAKEKKVDEVQLDYWSGNQVAEHFFLKNGFSCFNHRMRK